MNHLDSEQSRQNSTLKPHSVLFAMQLKARDLFHFLPCVSWFSNEVFNSSQHAKHVQTLCWASHSTFGILAQNRTELLIHSLQMLRPRPADRQTGVTDVRCPAAPEVALWDSGLMAFRRVIIDQVKFPTQEKWWLKENTLFHNRNGLNWFALNNLNLIISIQKNCVWRLCHEPGIPELRKCCLYSLNSLIHCSEIMIYTQVHWCRKRKVVLSLEDYLKYYGLGRLGGSVG